MLMLSAIMVNMVALEKPSVIAMLRRRTRLFVPAPANFAAPVRRLKQRMMPRISPDFIEGLLSDNGYPARKQICRIDFLHLCPRRFALQTDQAPTLNWLNLEP
jgi:hypothetical protein